MMLACFCGATFVVGRRSEEQIAFAAPASWAAEEERDERRKQVSNCD